MLGFLRVVGFLILWLLADLGGIALYRAIKGS